MANAEFLVKLEMTELQAAAVASLLECVDLTKGVGQELAEVYGALTEAFVDGEGIQTQYNQKTNLLEVDFEDEDAKDEGFNGKGN